MRILLIIYDNCSYIHQFPIGMAYIAAVLKGKGFDVEIYNQDINHYSDERLTYYLDQFHFDMVGIGTVAGYYPYKKLLSISKAINQSKNRKDFIYVIGGHMVSATPEYFMEKTGADVIIVGEGEIAILDVIESKKKGIYESTLIKDLDLLPQPAYELFPIGYYRLMRFPNCVNKDFTMSVISGRGCTFNCTFCYRLMKGIRLRSIKKIIQEIKYLKNKYGITYIDFADDLTMTSKDRMTELCESILSENLNIKWLCEGRLNFVDKNILTLMKKAGCVFINYGIEALDDIVLKTMNKALTVSQIYTGVTDTRDSGISMGLNIIWGNIGDTVGTLRLAVDFLKEYSDGSQIRTIRPVTPYPGCELFDTAIKLGLLKDAVDFYECKHINSDLLTVNFTGMTDYEFYQELNWANTVLLEDYYHKQLEKNKKQLKQLYFDKDVSFRGFRQT